MGSRPAGWMDSIIRRVVSLGLAFAAVVAYGTSNVVVGQSDGLLRLDDDVHTFLETQRTLGRLPHGHITHKPLSAYEAREYLQEVYATLEHQLSPLDTLPAADHALRTPLGPFYRNGSDFWRVRGASYAIQINPLLHLSVGQASLWGSGRPQGRAGRHVTWRNTRGVRASGHVGPHIFFEARVEETQERPAVIEFEPLSAPRLPSVRRFANQTAYDYQLGIGILGFRSEHFEVRLGRDRNHWGYGEGSLFLSDYAPAYDQLQIRTSFWRLQYVNLFAGFADVNPSVPHLPNSVIPRKYGAFHRLSVNITDRINLNVFEAVIFGPDSTTGRGEGFDFAYLNPVIFYRPVESDRGSPDNVLIGIGGSWIIVDGLRLYGSVLLDEFVASAIFGSSWLNKTGYLGGLHVVPSATLSLRAEVARLRPFLYTHRTTTTAYMHFSDHLGHPAGPNAVDVAFFANWQPHSPWHARLNFAYTQRGRGTQAYNVGSDLRLSFDTRVSDRAPFLQGIPEDRFLAELAAGYEILPDLHFEVVARGERIDDDVEGVSAFFEPFVSLRWGLPFASMRY